MKIIVPLLLVISFTITGCATTEKYNKVLDSWMGSNISELMNSWGYPQGSFDAPNGNKVYVYSSSGSFTTPTQSYSTVYGNQVYTNTYGGQTLNLNCNTYIETNDEGTIVNWSWKGNHCVAN